MSRRHQGRSHHHAQRGPNGARPVTGVSPGPNTNGAPSAAGSGGAAPAPRPQASAAGADEAQAQDAVTTARLGSPGAAPVAPPPDNARPGFVPHADARPPSNGSPGAIPPGAAGQDRNGQCTAPQLRRFIKSRPYVPMHELRRRFGIDGGDDDVTPVRLEPSWVYVGLPNREGLLLGELLRSGEIGYELSLDPRTPIVIGVYPMRPIPRS